MDEEEAPTKPEDKEPNPEKPASKKTQEARPEKKLALLMVVATGELALVAAVGSWVAWVVIHLVIGVVTLLVIATRARRSRRSGKSSRGGRTAKSTGGGLLGGRTAKSTGGGSESQARAQDARTMRPESVKPLVPKPPTRENRLGTRQGRQNDEVVGEGTSSGSGGSDIRDQQQVSSKGTHTMSEQTFKINTEAGLRDWAKVCRGVPTVVQELYDRYNKLEADTAEVRDKLRLLAMAGDDEQVSNVRPMVDELTEISKTLARLPEISRAMKTIQTQSEELWPTYLRVCADDEARFSGSRGNPRQERNADYGTNSD